MTSIGFTGTQQGMTEAQKASLRGLLDGGAGEFHHGDCVGADAEAHDIAASFGYQIHIHPPYNREKRAFKATDVSRIRPELSYLDRNKMIVRATASLIATPADHIEQLRSGTWSTVRYAKKLGKPVFVILPDGSIETYPDGVRREAGSADRYRVPWAEE